MLGGVREKIKICTGVSEKIKICEGGSVKFSIPPPPLRISNGIALIKTDRPGFYSSSYTFTYIHYPKPGKGY